MPARLPLQLPDRLVQRRRLPAHLPRQPRAAVQLSGGEGLLFRQGLGLQRRGLAQVRACVSCACTCVRVGALGWASLRLVCATA
jgi:hypothetical protein